MIELDKMLEYVQRINPTMTREKLIEELCKSQYSSVALVIVSQNISQEK